MAIATRSRFRAGLAAAALAILAIAPSALADTVYWSSGKVGVFDVVDTGKKPGATCIDYGEGTLGIQAREPRVFARDRTGGEDRQKVGWQVIVQRKEPGQGWVNLAYSTIFTATATDKTPADFVGGPAFAVMGSEFRVVDILMWYGADGTTIKGAADSRVTYYQQILAGSSLVAFKSCVS